MCNMYIYTYIMKMASDAQPLSYMPPMLDTPNGDPRLSDGDKSNIGTRLLSRI